MAQLLLERNLTATFDMLDWDGSGQVERTDLDQLAMWVAATLAPGDRRRARAIRRAYREFWYRLYLYTDTDRDGKISRDEFTAGIRSGILENSDYVGHVLLPIARALWWALDTDGNGFLCEQEFAQIVALGRVTREQAREVFNTIDADGDGVLTFDEFISSTRKIFTHGDAMASGSWMFGRPA